MKPARVVLVSLLAALLFMPIVAQGSYMGNYMNGTKYMQLDDTSRTYLVLGMYDMLSFEWDQPLYRDAADYNTKSHMSRVKRCLEQKSPNQLRAMLDQYLASTPDAGRYNIASNFLAAMNTLCPQ